MHESIVCSTHSQSQEVILEKLLKAQEVMEILAIGKSHLYKLIRTKKLPSISIGHTRRFRPSDVTAFIEKNRNR